MFFFLQVIFITLEHNIFFKYELGGSEDKIDRINLSFGEYLFKENSHLGMIAPSFILFFLYTHTNEKLYSIKFFLFYVFLLLCFIKSSTTLLLGLCLFHH